MTVGWLLSPSGWPVYADTSEEHADLSGRGYSVLAADQVQAAVDAFRAAEASPPSTQLPGWALATDVAAALATKANASSLGLKQDKATLGADVAADATVRAALVPRWKAATAYAANDIVLSPAGKLVQAKTSFTSGGSFDPTKWTDLYDAAYDLQRAPIQHRYDSNEIEISTVGAWTRPTGTGFYNNKYAQSSGAQNDEIVFAPRYFAAGTWQLAMEHALGNNRGIYTFSISSDGLTWTDIGTIDGYNAVASATARGLTPTFYVATSTMYFLRVKMLGKNAASSGYFAQISGLLASRQVGRPAILFGDSITANATAAGGWFPVANAAAGYRLSVVRNAGIGGNTTAQMLARVATDVVAFHPEYVTVMGGTNNLVDGVAGVTSDLTAIYNAIAAGGSKIIACTITPRTDLDATYQARVVAINDWIKAHYSDWAGAKLCDWNPVLTPDGLPGGAANAAYLTDAVHPNTTGQARMAGVLDDVLLTIPPAWT